MLTIKTTPHQFGISLQGDYEDLNALYDALHRYLYFYQEHSGTYPYHEYEYLLSLNYDIRHAYMGTRGYTMIDNPYGAKHKKNLYYQVEIMYPLVFHYLISFERILDDYYIPEWFQNKDPEEYPFSYDIMAADRDRAQIRMFDMLLWDNVKELFGEKRALAAYNYYSYQEEGFTPALYIDALLHDMLVRFATLSPEAKKDYLYLSLLEITDSEELIDYTDEFEDSAEMYTQALERFNKQHSFFVTQDYFYRKFDQAIPRDKPLYEDTFEAFLRQTLGTIQDEEPEW